MHVIRGASCIIFIKKKNSYPKVFRGLIFYFVSWIANNALQQLALLKRAGTM